MTTYFKRFAEIESYSDPGSQGQTCRDILPGGILAGVSIGYNILEGPARVGRHQHTWDQAFVTVKGSGVLELGEERIRLEPESIVVVPAGIEHDTIVAPGGRIEYVYVNNYPK